MTSGRAGRTRRNLLVAALGLATYLTVHALLLIAWTDFFSSAPWPGYEESTRLGLVEPWFINTPRSLWLTRFVMFTTAFVTAFVLRRARWSAAASLWSGAAVGIIATWATTDLRSIDGGSLGYVFYPFRVLLPIVLGTALAELARRTIARPRGVDVA